MADANPSAAPERSKLWTVIICALVAVFEGFDLQAPGVAAPRLAPTLGLSGHELGMFFSAGTFGMMIGATVGGRLADRFGRRAALLFSIASFGVFSLATGFASDIDGLVIARFLTGVGLGGALPTLIAVVAEHVSPERRSAAVGVLYAGMPCGGAAVSLISLIGAAPDNWQIVFYVGGIAPLLTIGFLVRLLPASLPSADHARPGNKGYAAAVFGEQRTLSSLLLWAGFFLALIILYLLLSWLPLLLIGRGLSRPDASMVQMAFNLFGAIGSVLTGWLMDHRRYRTMLLTVLFGAAAIMLFIVAEAPASMALSMAIGAALGATVMGSQAALYGLAPSVYPAPLRGTGVGVGVTFGRLGSIAGPLLAPLLLGLGWGPSQVLVALVPVVALCGLATVTLSRRSVPQL